MGAFILVFINTTEVITTGTNDDKTFAELRAQLGGACV